MDRVYLSQWQDSIEGRRTYEFSKLEYVLPVFVTALQGAIYLIRRGGEKDYLPLYFRKLY